MTGVSDASAPPDPEGDEVDGAGTSPDPKPQFRTPTLAGRHVYLRPVGPQDYGFLRSMDLSPELGLRWRFRGSTPSMEQWVRETNSLLVHHLVLRSADHEPIGVTAAYRQSFQDQHAYIAAASFQPDGRSPLLLMGMALFIEYTFTCWPFRKLYLELAEFNVGQFAAAVGTLLTEEGRLRGHVYYDGRFWDMLVLALYRETWKLHSARLLAATLPAPGQHATVSLPAKP